MACGVDAVLVNVHRTGSISRSVCIVDAVRRPLPWHQWELQRFSVDAKHSIDDGVMRWVKGFPRVIMR
jgi:hypothetical protein